MTPPLSLGMPVYNGTRWLSSTFDALLGQTYGDFELIVSDNASTDATGDICREVAARDRRVRYVRQPVNIGNDPNYNAVHALARGEYFKWTSCNDLVDREFLAKCMAVLTRQSDAALAYARTRLIDGQGGKIADYDDNVDLQDERPSVRAEKLMQQMRLNNAFNGVFRMSALTPAMPLGLYANSDVNLMLEVALAGKFVEVPEFLFFRRMDPEACVALGLLEENTGKVSTAAQQGAYRGGMNFSRFCLGSFQAAARAPISTAERLRLLGILARRLSWGRKELAREIGREFATALGRR